ncbi:MAG TPA: hypothetical protein VET89_14705 [Stellaceae bacterium]|nr:hypothetical protein [Stellaceae bacterium]
MTLRNAVHTRSDQSLCNTIAVSATTTFLVSTDDPSLILTAVPAPALALTFQSGSAIPLYLSQPTLPQLPALPLSPPPPREDPEPRRPREDENVAASEPPAARVEDEEPEAPPNHSHQIELIIDSLPHRMLTEPIPVSIEALGDKVFTASVRNIGIHATGTSIGEALLVLKEQIEEIYGDLNDRSSHLDAEQKKTLQLLHTYIEPPIARRPEWSRV